MAGFFVPAILSATPQPRCDTVAPLRRVHYASDMIKTILTAFFLLPGVALAVICKTVDADGVVSYSDVPSAECENRLKLPASSTYAPRPIEQPQQQRSGATGSVIDFTRYESIRIEQPKQGGIVRSNEGRVTVVVGLQPALQPGHRVSLTVDGLAVGGSFDGLAIEVSGVERGTHTLRASVADANGRLLLSSSPVRFTLRKLGLTDSNPDNQPPPPPKPDPGFPAPTTPPDYTPPKPDYKPPADADYTPEPSPGYKPPASPGYAPGSSYKPNYTP